MNRQFAQSSFDNTSRELIQIVASIENQCGYCVAGHTAFAELQHVPADVVASLRNGQAIENNKLEALRNFTRQLVRNKGMVSDQAVQEFLDAGYTREQFFELILGICVKTFSNLVGNALAVPLDDQFKGHAWEPLSVSRAA